MNTESTAEDTPAEQVACRKSVLRGGSWVLVGYGLGQVLRIVSNFILANLLFPKDFGLMALVNVFLAGLQMFSDIGMGPCIVRSLSDRVAYARQAGKNVITLLIEIQSAESP